ncbi:MAG: TonB-dependent receptor, partial [Janthinobacterium lividum]
TQHSGDGKANQYFSRGFNLDHGTDFRTSLMGMPVNLPTNAHGQGYSDLNFIIPELVRTIEYKKGTYYAEEGDFSAAGAAAFDYFRELPRGLLSVEAGQNHYRRVVLANSTAIGPGSLLYGFEGAGQDGPWESPEHYKRFNGFLSYSWKAGSDDVRVAAMALQSSWNATDQVPQRAIDSGLIGRYGTLDPTDGGETARYSLSADWTRRHENGFTKVNAYVVKSRLDLFSNFTFNLDDPVNGDQFHQSERRAIVGLNAERTLLHKLAGFDSETTAGVQLRHDSLDPVALYSTSARQQVSVTREDQVRQGSAALFLSNTTRWLPWFRTVTGLRHDRYSFDVDSSIAANSGKVDASITSPKFSAIFTPIGNTELYANWGQGFHSNDARGITNTVDPKTGSTLDASGAAVAQATPLVKATGKEVGLRVNGLLPGLQTSLSVWRLDLASELVFVGDAGTTEAGRPSHRSGIELSNYYVPAKGWIVDADLAWSRARFTDAGSAGPFVPGAVDRTASVGVSGEFGKWSGGARLRYFGPRALVEDDSVKSPSSTLVNLKLGYALSKDVKLTAEVLNVFDRRVSDIDYLYASQLAGETAPVTDIHTHPAEPRALRVGVVIRF